MIRIRSVTLLVALFAAATGAAAEERCEGTLCDLYYGGSGPEKPAAAQPAAPKPLTTAALPNVSGAGTYLGNLFSRSGSEPAAQGATAQGTAQGAAQAPAASQDGQREGFFRMGGGGVTGRKAAGECGGTICDLLHGHSAEDDGGSSTSQSVNGVPQSRYGSETASAEPVAAPAAQIAAPAEAAAPMQRRVAVRAEPKPPACASKTADPWACYRR